MLYPIPSLIKLLSGKQHYSLPQPFVQPSTQPSSRKKKKIKGSLCNKLRKKRKIAYCPSPQTSTVKTICNTAVPLCLLKTISYMDHFNDPASTMTPQAAIRPTKGTANSLIGEYYSQTCITYTHNSTEFCTITWKLKTWKYSFYNKNNWMCCGLVWDLGLPPWGFRPFRELFTR